LDCVAETSRVQITNFGEFSRPLRPSHFALFRNGLAVVDGTKPSVSFVDLGTGIRLDVNCHYGEANCVSDSNGWVATGGRDAMVKVFATDNLREPVFSIALYHDEITCCSVSNDFGLIASGTRDGFLVLSSLNTGSNTRVIDIGARPYAVLITQKWGFVVICSTKLANGTLEHAISVYTVNGSFVRSRQIAGAVAVWTAWSSASGFDFIIMVGEVGRVWYFEVCKLDVTPFKGYTANPPVIAIRYSPRERGVTVVSGKGAVAFVPWVHEKAGA
jgi:WD40 repeat protein